jgi:hypothetical protein
LIKERLIDLVKDFFTIGHELHIYKPLDIALSMNCRVLIKHDKNLYSDSTMIRENRTFRFQILKHLVLLPGAFLNCYNFLIRSSNYVFHVSILIISTRASTLAAQIFSLAPYSCTSMHFFVSCVKSIQILLEARA